MTSNSRLYRKGIIMLVASGFFLSTAGIALRIVEQADGWQILFYRALSLSLTIFLFLTYQKGSAVLDDFRGLGWNDALLAIFLGTGFVAYVFALLYNTIANALFIFSSAPFVAALLGWIVLGERVALRTWGCIAGAMAGLAIMVASGLAAGRYLGNLIALWIPISYAATIVLVRRSERQNMLSGLCLAGLVAAAWSDHKILSLCPPPDPPCKNDRKNKNKHLCFFKNKSSDRKALRGVYALRFCAANYGVAQ